MYALHTKILQLRWKIATKTWYVYVYVCVYPLRACTRRPPPLSKRQEEVIEQLDTVTKTLNQHLDTAEKLSKALSTKESSDTSQLKEMTTQVRELAKQVSKLTQEADQQRQGLLKCVVKIVTKTKRLQ